MPDAMLDVKKSEINKESKQRREDTKTERFAILCVLFTKYLFMLIDMSKGLWSLENRATESAPRNHRISQTGHDH